MIKFFGENGTRLSGGEKQRLIHSSCNAKDESNNSFGRSNLSLDAETESKIQEAIMF